jgi:uncharacterized protein
MSELEKRIDILVRQIVDIARPLRIVLFGSATSENVLPGSDLDVLVVMPAGTHRRQTAQRLYREISGVGMPFDLIIATPQDLVNHQNNIGLIYHSILRDGKEIYAA